MLECDDRTAVVSFGGVRAPHQVAEEADAVDVALALVMFYGVPDSAIRAPPTTRRTWRLLAAFAARLTHRAGVIDTSTLRPGAKA